MLPLNPKSITKCQMWGSKIVLFVHLQQMVLDSTKVNHGNDNVQYKFYPFCIFMLCWRLSWPGLIHMEGNSIIAGRRVQGKFVYSAIAQSTANQWSTYILCILPWPERFLICTYRFLKFVFAFSNLDHSCLTLQCDFCVNNKVGWLVGWFVCLF